MDLSVASRRSDTRRRGDAVMRLLLLLLLLAMFSGAYDGAS